MDTIIWCITITFIAVTLELLLAPVIYNEFLYKDDFTDFLVRFFGDIYVLPFLGIIWGMIDFCFIESYHHFTADQSLGNPLLATSSYHFLGGRIIP